VSTENPAQYVEDLRIAVERASELVGSAVNVRGSKPEIC
jgi:hypothetical protein